MLQRIQTLLLLVVAVAMAAVTASLPIWEKSSATLNEKVRLTAFSLEHLKGDTIVSNDSTAVIGILGIIVVCIAIFFNYTIQKKSFTNDLGLN